MQHFLEWGAVLTPLTQIVTGVLLTLPKVAPFRRSAVPVHCPQQAASDNLPQTVLSEHHLKPQEHHLTSRSTRFGWELCPLKMSQNGKEEHGQEFKIPSVLEFEILL